jgi:hypothetical protein
MVTECADPANSHAKLFADRPFKFDFRAQALEVSEDRGNRELPVRVAIDRHAVLRLYPSVNFDSVPFFRVFDMADVEIVVRLQKSAVPLLGAPTGNRVKRSRAEGLAGTQTETRVVPGAADGVVHNKTLGKRHAVVRAGGADRKQLIAAPREEHRFALRTADQHAAVSDCRGGRSLGEVRPAGKSLESSLADAIECDGRPPASRRSTMRHFRHVSRRDYRTARVRGE